MSDTIKRWECPECGRRVFTPDLPHRTVFTPYLESGDDPPCPGVPVERTYVAEDALLSDAAVNAASADNGSGAQCGIEEYGGCGGTHTNCYYRSKLRAAIDAANRPRP